MSKPHLPADISMESFLRWVSLPERWINNFKYGYPKSMEAYDRETLAAAIVDIRKSKLEALRGSNH